MRRSRHALDYGAIAADDARKSSGAGVSRDDVAATLAPFASDAAADDKDSLLGAFLSSPAARRLQQLFLDLAVQ